jgi:hypothetical protein
LETHRKVSNAAIESFLNIDGIIINNQPLIADTFKTIFSQYLTTFTSIKITLMHKTNINPIMTIIMSQRATAPSSVMTHEASDVKATRTFPCKKELEHSRAYLLQ